MYFPFHLNCDLVSSLLRNKIIPLMPTPPERIVFLFRTFLIFFPFLSIVLNKNEVVVLDSVIKQNALNAVKFDPALIVI